MRAGPLALVGGNEFQPGNEEQDRALVAAAGGGPSFVVATAAARQHPEYAVRNARAWFAGLGLEVEELPARRRSDATSAGHASLARSGRFFYLVGGDPGLVPSVLSETPLWQAVVDAWRAGAALAGSSAGAMALGEWTLIRARYPGDRSRRPRPALTLVPGVALIPHFDSFGAGWVEGTRATAPRADAVLLGVDERSAAVWHEGEWRAFGPGGVTVISGDDRRRYASGEVIDGIPEPLF